MQSSSIRTACATRLPLLLLLLTLPAALQAQDYTYTTNNGAITITAYTGPGGAVTIPDTIYGLPVTSIGDSAFYSCTSLTSVTIPNSVTSIGGYAFEGCWSLTSVMIPDSVTNIGVCPFGRCTSLTAITVDPLNSVYSSVDGVLFNKSQTTLIQYPGGKAGSYTVPSSVTRIRASAFSECSSLTSVTIPNSVTYIGDRAFEYCSSLTNITLSTNATSIGYSAFLSCTSLTNVTIGNSVTNIGDWAFVGCYDLTSVTIPNSVTTIGEQAFASCMSLITVSIPSSVTSIGEGAFFFCPSLGAIAVDSNNPAYSSVDGVLFNKSQTILIQCPGAKAGSYTVPNSVTNIGPAAFDSCANLISATIPNSVTSIGDMAFGLCPSLTGVYFQGDAPGLGGSYVFWGDDNATVYYLPGTTGWGATFGGRPTALWVLPKPLILNNGPSFGVQTNRFGFIISWATNLSVVVEACTNLANPIWVPVGTNILTGGSSYFGDPQWTNYPGRFYRLRSP